MKYSIIRSGNKQYMVQEGDELNVELLSQQEGKVELETLLRVNDEEVEIGEPTLKASAKAEILGEVKGSKKTGIKYKPGGYRRKFGHRQPYTKVKITAI